MTDSGGKASPAQGGRSTLSESKKAPPVQGKETLAERKETERRRLAAALRANLTRRKAQGRDREASHLAAGQAASDPGRRERGED